MRKSKALAVPLIIVCICIMLLLTLRNSQHPTRFQLQQSQHTYLTYLPVTIKAPPGIRPDIRFGVAEYGAADMYTLGFSEDGRYHSQQWYQQEEGNSVIFFRGAHRTHVRSRWCTCAFRFAGRVDYCSGDGAMLHEAGWVNEIACRQWISAHPGKTYIIGNEIDLSDPIGDGITPAEYAVWYNAAWRLIKSTDPTAKVGPFGPVQNSKWVLLDVWTQYHLIAKQPLPADFYPIHFYAQSVIHSRNIVDFESWVAWIESHRGADWSGPREYWLTEYGLPTWENPHIMDEDLLVFMEDFTHYLMTNQVGVTLWAWWPCVSHPRGTTRGDLVMNGKRTALGDLYIRLATDATTRPLLAVLQTK